ncbi:hypothetical protein BIV57_04180 [Mangrovactinospora gilvigrisea]|uniref:Secreted protein n=1 Tax=Mangrovactinospora gilvigrisea TaxID=1428644 RepID=A0A1J7BJD5_9ACTN|nr:hypothetical protein [Mangrovactinospora gilvigrisea]OIV38750.1 hypothetical protein BIV57_04180 [Mangrovactinospora gilvigrisea]
MRTWTGRITKAVVAGAVATAGLALSTGSAHANEAAACRSKTTHSLAKVADNLYLDSCYHVLADGASMHAVIGVFNQTGHAFTYCAHAINVNNPAGPWAHDFGCTSTNAQSAYFNAGTDKPYGPSWEQWHAGPGTYVISTGVWIDGHYAGDVESPRTTIG